jgi:hypothetical protein
MHPSKKSLILINVIAGLAVLGSYIWGFLTYPNAGEILWGGVPIKLRLLYTISMFLAAGGYFAFSLYILSLNPNKTKNRKRPGYRIFNTLFLGILIPSALWLPLTMLAVEHTSQPLVWLVRLDLVLVAIASLGLLITLLKVQPRKIIWLHYLAVLGCVLFCFQTVTLDAIVWAVNFHL